MDIPAIETATPAWLLTALAIVACIIVIALLLAFAEYLHRRKDDNRHG